MLIKKYKSHFTIEESDVTIITEIENNLEVAIKNLVENREIIKNTIRKYPQFQKSYKPYFIEEVDTPEIIIRMQDAAEICDVGPMAAVAGALADLVSETLKSKGSRISVVENGGEIMIDSKEDIYIALYSMTTVLKAKVGFLFEGGSKLMGIGTSSGTFGHAVSLGKADTVTVFAINASIGDAAATRVANEVKGVDLEGSVGKGLEMADSLEKVEGVFISRGKFVGKSGNIPKLISIDDRFEKEFLKSKVDGFLPDKFKIF